MSAPIPTASTRASRVLSAVLILLVAAAVLFAPQLLSLGRKVEPEEIDAGRKEEVDDEGEEGKVWPGMWLFNRNGERVIHIMSNGRRESGVGGLVFHLKHEEPGIRESAAEWLKAIGPEARDALPALRETLIDPDARVRAAAGAAIKSIEKKRPANRA
jgi:hypothetical protein